jgi:diaminopimelate epimerase
MVKEKRFSVETGAGILWPEIIEVNEKVSIIKVDMGESCLIPEKIPVLIYEKRVINYPVTVQDKTFYFTPVSMGNPHAVIFELPQEWETFGKEIETHKLFPHKTNVEFVNIINKNEALVKVWERGSGATYACGTGACAVLVAGVVNKLLDRNGEIHLPGGTLSITWSESDNHIYMEGPAEEVYTGEFMIC